MTDYSKALELVKEGKTLPEIYIELNVEAQYPTFRKALWRTCKSNGVTLKAGDGMNRNTGKETYNVKRATTNYYNGISMGAIYSIEKIDGYKYCYDVFERIFNKQLAKDTAETQEEERVEEQPQKPEVWLGQLCWYCEKASGGRGCCWADKLKPVKGWTATKKHHASGSSYRIKQCPLFERTRRFANKGNKTQ